MTVDRLARSVREQIAFGRVLPLGGAGDGVWITESAAADALRGAVAGLTGVRVGALRIGPEAVRVPRQEAEPVTEPTTDTDTAGGALVPLVPLVPPSAVPYGPLCVAAAFEAAIDRPLPATAERLRTALWSAAHDLLGLAVTSVDLDVTGLMDPPAGPGVLPVLDPAPVPALATGEDLPPAGNGVVAAALLVPGVARVTSRLGGFASGIRTADGGDPPAREVRVQIAVVPGHRALDVARAVAAAVTAAAEPGSPGPVTTAVVVTAIG